MNNNVNSAIRKFISSDDALARFEHRGGTQTKTDAVCICSDNTNITISLKNHKTGTFDWLNSTSAIDRETYVTITTEFKKIKDDFAVHGGPVDAVRPLVAAICTNTLIRTTHEQIRTLLRSIYDKYSDVTVIHDLEKKQLVGFLKTELTELQTFNGHTYFLKQGKKKTATHIAIWRRNDDTLVETNTDLLLRLVLNNGVTALLGIGNNNKTSVPCLKIQQQKVRQFINNLGGAVHEPYTPVAVDSSIQTDVPTNIQVDMQDDVPTNIHVDIQEDVPVDVPTNIRFDIQEDVPDDVPTNIRFDIQEDVPVDVPTNIPVDVQTESTASSSSSSSI